MPQVKITQDHSIVVDKNTKRTFPKGWTGPVTTKELKSIIDAKAGEEVGGEKKTAKKAD